MASASSEVDVAAIIFLELLMRTCASLVELVNSLAIMKLKLIFSMNLIERQRHERICSLLITIHTSWIDRKLLVPICVSWKYKVVEWILGYIFKFSKVEKVDHLLSSLCMLNFICTHCQVQFLLSPAFIVSKFCCLIPIRWSFFTVISFLRHCHICIRENPVRILNLHNLTRNLCLSFLNYMFGTNGFMSQNKFFNTHFIQAQWAKSYQAQFKINRGLTN